MSNYYKICENCGEENDILETFCTGCLGNNFKEEDLSAPQKDIEYSKDLDYQTVEEYKICQDCAERNNISETFCIECLGKNFIKEQENLSKDIDGVKNKNYDARTILEEKKHILRLKSHELDIKIKENDIVGRDANLGEFLKNNLKISRLHIKFFYENDNWLIQDLNSTNGTFINDIRLFPNEKRIIKNDDILKLASNFLINIKIE